MDKMEVIFILIALAAILLVRFLYQNGFSGAKVNPEVKEKQIKVACVGDSITYGFGIKNWPKNNYPTQLQNMLGENFNVANFGVSGCCVGRKTELSFLKTKTYLDSLEYKADILILMMGSNDSIAFNWTNREKFKEEYLHLLETYVKDKDIKVYLCTVSKAYFPKGRTTGMTNFGIQPKIIEIIVEIIKEIATERNYELIDIYEITSQNYDWFKKDKVHPNKDGALAIAEEVYRKIKTNEQP